MLLDTTTQQTTVKAIVHDAYGTPDVLRLEDRPRPTPGPGEVLVRVHASSVNPADVFLLRGSPLLLRVSGYGLFEPKHRVGGWDVAGTVVEVGADVTRFRPGDEVYGEHEGGSYIEVTCVEQDRLARKPARLSFEQAAAMPVAGFTALKALRDVAELQAGQKILINGAAGGIGTFAVQMARSFGAEVTGVCSTRNVELVRSLGADHVIDYTREDFTRGEQRYDVILDNVENHPLSEVRRVLTSDGTLLCNAGPNQASRRGRRVMTRMMWSSLVNLVTRQQILHFYASPRHDDLVALAELAEEGAFTPVIDRVYPLEQVPDAMRHVATGHARGKVVVSVS